MHNHKIAAAEAVLFSMGHEVRVTELAQALDLSEEEMTSLLSNGDVTITLIYQ